MKVIPVIDILNGVAVHGICGERKRYQPLKSVLCESAEHPLNIVSAFNSLGFSSMYLADLDAILKNSANFSIYRQIISNTDLYLMVDAGIADMAKAEEVLATGASKVVVGSETLGSLDFLGQAVKTYGSDRVLVSMDLKEGKLLSTSETIAAMDSILFAQELGKIGVEQIIVLDLGRVGTEHGINLPLIKTIIEKTGVEVLVGGGIRGLKELEQLRTLGVSGTLVATILHNGKLEVDQLKSAGFM